MRNIERTFSLKMIGLHLKQDNVSLSDIPSLIDIIYERFNMGVDDILVIRQQNLDYLFNNKGNSVGTRERNNMPGIAAMAKNLANSAAKTIKSAVKNEKIIVDKEIFEARKAECSKCEEWDPSSQRCRICGCKTNFKLRLANEQCPHPQGPRWTSVS